MYLNFSLHRRDWPWAVDSTFGSSPLPRGEGGWRVGLKVPALQSHDWLPWQPAAILRCFPNVTSLNNKKTRFLFSTLRKFQGFQELWAKNCGRRPNIYDKYILVIWMTKYIFLINHNIAAVLWSSQPSFSFYYSTIFSILPPDKMTPWAPAITTV